MPSFVKSALSGVIGIGTLSGEARRAGGSLDKSGGSDCHLSAVEGGGRVLLVVGVEMGSSRPAWWAARDELTSVDMLPCYLRDLRARAVTMLCGRCGIFETVGYYAPQG